MANTVRRHTTERAEKARLTPTDVMVVVLMMLALIAATLLTGEHRPASLETVPIRVEQGDTLWSLARRYPVAGRTTEQTVLLLSGINGLSGSSIAAGMSLDVPAPAGTGSALALR